jgi:hypothetical protein
MCYLYSTQLSLILKVQTRQFVLMASDCEVLCTGMFNAVSRRNFNFDLLRSAFLSQIGV